LINAELLYHNIVLKKRGVRILGMQAFLVSAYLFFDN
jgi:hypothetical protein